MAALSNIWLARNSEVIPKKKVSLATTKIKIWNQIRLDMKCTWKQQHERVRSDSLDLYDAQYSFEFDFCSNSQIYTVQGYKIEVACIPPEPD